MVGCLAVGGAPFFGFASDDIHRGAMALDEDGFDLRNVADLRAQFERGFDGALGMVFCGPELDAGIQDHEVGGALTRRYIATPSFDMRLKRAAHEFFETFLTFKNR